MRPLILGPGEKQEIRRCVDYARQREHWYAPFSLKSTIPGSVPAHIVHVPKGFRCVYSLTLDQHDKLWRYLTVSVDNEKYPSPEAIVLLGREFGFTGTIPANLDIARMLDHGWQVSIHEGSHCIVLAQEVVKSL